MIVEGIDGGSYDANGESIEREKRHMEMRVEGVANTEKKAKSHHLLH